MFPHAGAGGDVTAGRIPVNVRDTVMVSRGHQLQVGREVFVTFRSFTFIVKVPEVEVKTLLGMDRGHHHEAAFRGPVDGVAVLLVNGADMLEVAHSGAFDLLRTEEGYCCFWRYCCGYHNFCRGD